MPPLCYFKRKPQLAQSSLVSAILFVFLSTSGASSATTLDGITVNGSDRVINVSDTELRIGQGDGQWNYPITFTGNGELTINFTEDAGTVFIDTLNPEMSDGGVNTQNSSEGNLVITNGSLDINLSGDVWSNQGTFTLAFGGSLYIEKDLKVNYSAFISDTLSSDHPYVGLLAADTAIDIGGNVDISLNTRLEMESVGPSILVGIWNDLRSDGLEDSGRMWNFGSNGGTLRVHDVIASSSTNVTEAYGIRIDSENTHVVVHNAAIIEDIHSFTQSTNHSAYAVGAEVSGGQIDFLGSVQIKNISAQSSSTQSAQPWIELPSGTGQSVDEAYALAAFHGGTINVTPSSDDVIQIENDMIVTDGGAINANFTNANSHFIGTTKNYVDVQPGATAGEMNLSFKNGAYWQVTESNSQAVALTLEDSNVYLNQNSSGEDSTLTRDNAINLKLSELAGNNGLFFIRTSLEETYGDSVSIEKATGQHKLMLSSSGTNPTKVATDRALVTQNEGDATFSLANANGVIDLGNYVYSLNSRTGSDGSTQWYLATDSANPDVEQLSPSANAVLALAGSGSQTTQFLYSLSDLRKRMGDIRHGVSEGLYASLRGGKDRISGFASTSFKNEYAALSLGYDKKVNNNWILGLSFEAIEGDQTVKGGGYKAEGEDSTQSIKAYATWFNDIGCYADFVIGINRFDQDISTHMLDGQKVKGDYSSYGFGVSTEVGKRFTLGADETWFIEPQAQLSYFQVHGKDFRLNNGMSVEQENADSLTGRLGVVVGRTLLDDSGHGVQFSARAGFNHEFLGDANIYVNKERFTDDSLGSRGYYGLGVGWYASDSVKVYGYIEREEGSHYTSEFNARVGVKYHF